MNHIAIMPIVSNLLTNHQRLRDDDCKLIVNVWMKELRKTKDQLQKMSGLEVLELVSRGAVTKPESITRARRKLQEEYPHLRGFSYVRRHQKAEETRKTI